ncbi:MAG: GntR family transcriptional regulator [Acidobacteriota bacterium]
MSSKKNTGLFSVEIDSPVPLYEQIKREIKINILSGILLPDDKLLPIREYAKKLKVNPNTIVKVYYQLDQEGYLYSKAGQGYFVKETGGGNSPEDKKMFNIITDEYLKKSTDLGYSMDSILKNLKLRQKNKK